MAKASASAGCAASQSASVPEGLLRLRSSRARNQRSVLAMHAGYDISTELSDLSESFQQDIVRYGVHDARKTAHIELERADTVLLRVIRHFRDLLVGEYLRMEDRIRKARSSMARRKRETRAIRPVAEHGCLDLRRTLRRHRCKPRIRLGRFVSMKLALVSSSLSPRALQAQPSTSQRSTARHCPQWRAVPFG